MIFFKRNRPYNREAELKYKVKQVRFLAEMLDKALALVEEITDDFDKMLKNNETKADRITFDRIAKKIKVMRDITNNARSKSYVNEKGELER
jgi:hypothetical protein